MMKLSYLYQIVQVCVVFIFIKVVGDYWYSTSFLGGRGGRAILTIYYRINWEGGKVGKP